jgi:hypothetical protein
MAVIIIDMNSWEVVEHHESDAELGFVDGDAEMGDKKHKREIDDVPRPQLQIVEHDFVVEDSVVDQNQKRIEELEDSLSLNP